jgi:hypothetical protein
VLILVGLAAHVVESDREETPPEQDERGVWRRWFERVRLLAAVLGVIALLVALHLAAFADWP